ncbi:hypothetical protein HCN44_000314 [Aphidius gifuensis]|uniref:F-box domain-containing protein n=1 Tax=Aphidius gifuensis TaxID=684658 RepID=A0A835CN64_APHGI|nr:hypothetical protein HCN44_000314 [Aphidius gifuensis]
MDIKKTITNLNDDCLTIIMQKLPVDDRINMNKVCIKMKKINQQSWWDIKKLKFDSIKMSNMVVLQHCGKFLLDLNITIDINDDFVNEIKKQCRLLRTLKITTTWNDINSSCLINFCTNMTSLKEIKIQEKNLKGLFRSNWTYENILISLPKTIESIVFPWPEELIVWDDIPPMVTRYQLFTFTEENAEDSLSIDFPPSEWIDFDQDEGKLMCKFMPPPYNKKNLHILDTMRKRCDPPLGE